MGLPQVSLKNSGMRYIVSQVWDVVNFFFAGGHKLRETNMTLITLIPKTAQPQQLLQFRPISLCNITYKIIAKVMVGRMRNVLPNFISEEKNAFVPGQIHA